ncbi:MAG TPA: DUF1707 domain-containing protein [Actinoplanes sp.]|nr:DUF1707 domain-containing protein [Actinoplanes sp.]
MAKDVAKSGGRPDPVHMRAADADRQKVADRLQAALDEGRLSLHEYDERVKAAYAARTYADLLGLLTDLPAPGLSADEVAAGRRAELKREARKLPMALMVLWTIWGALAAVNVVIYTLVAFTVEDDVYPWPVWLLVPGAALWAVTVGVQSMRRRNRR